MWRRCERMELHDWYPFSSFLFETLIYSTCMTGHTNFNFIPNIFLLIFYYILLVFYIVTILNANFLNIKLCSTFSKATILRGLLRNYWDILIFFSLIVGIKLVRYMYLTYALLFNGKRLILNRCVGVEVEHSPRVREIWARSPVT